MRFTLIATLIIPAIVATFLVISLTYQDQETRDTYTKVTTRRYGWPWMCAAKHRRQQYNREISDDANITDDIELWSIAPRGLVSNLLVAVMICISVRDGPRLVLWLFTSDPYGDRNAKE